MRKIIFTVSSFLITAGTALAQEKSRFIQCNPALSPSEPGACNISAFIQFIKNIIQFLFTVAIPLGVIFIVWGAFVIMTASGSEERLKKGKGIIQAAVVGVVILAAAWLAVTTIVKFLKTGTF